MYYVFIYIILNLNYVSKIPRNSTTKPPAHPHISSTGVEAVSHVRHGRFGAHAHLGVGFEDFHLGHADGDGATGGGGVKKGTFINKKKNPKSTLLADNTRVNNNKTNKAQASRFCALHPIIPAYF